jgi:hypothetical protein
MNYWGLNVVVLVDDFGRYTDEEQKRKAKLEAVLKSVSQPITNPKTGAPQQASKWNLYKTPSSVFKTQLQSRLSESSASKPASPLQRYFQMAQKDGEDNVKTRIKECTGIWKRYYAPYGGASIVWGMVDSPLSTYELEQAAKEGHKVLFNQRVEQGQNFLPTNTIPGAVNSKDSNMLRIVTGNLGLGGRASFSTSSESGTSATLPGELIQVPGREPFRSTATTIASTADIPIPDNYTGQETAYLPRMSPEDLYVYGDTPSSAVKDTILPAVQNDLVALSDLTYQQQREIWANELYVSNPAVVDPVEKLTGVKRSGFSTWYD